ncbi:MULTISPECIES: type II toxin-antitoxin system tRNA(fMet)-specific endonuclease VapC [Pseudomonas]|uniref:Ribonuclease VapC n=1 Tax=Pseudomonas gingeri TaxID=117681 RepID=A0A7Y7WX36_9PSED|nr:MULTISPECIES: type II toxin-antitoxin system VapC family toxin [Pseudomonas]MPQ70984.1 PIN domain-containing protein [Pseudomonas sp. MWU12-2323]NWB89092.1 type II toxin-antitoxin system VapC family toxin [Pseudomonas gingeri]
MSVRYLLDTNICIYIAKHNPPEVRERFARHRASELAMSVITLGELRFGAEKSQAKERSLAVLHQLESLIQVVPLEEGTGEHYGQIRAQLQACGRVIGNNDLWLAAHARSNGWILVSNNLREFDRVPGLQVENWIEG